MPIFGSSSTAAPPCTAAERRLCKKAARPGGQKLTYRELRERYLCPVQPVSGLWTAGKANRHSRTEQLGMGGYPIWLRRRSGVAVPLDKELHDATLPISRLMRLAPPFASRTIGAESLSADSMQVYRFSEVMLLSGVKNASDEKAVDGIPLRKDEMQVLIFTSGTTGHAKACACRSLPSAPTSIRRCRRSKSGRRM